MEMFCLFHYLLPVHIAGTLCRKRMCGDPVGHMYTSHVKYSRVMVKFMHHKLLSHNSPEELGAFQFVLNSVPLSAVIILGKPMHSHKNRQGYRIQ